MFQAINDFFLRIMQMGNTGRILIILLVLLIYFTIKHYKNNTDKYRIIEEDDKDWRRKYL